MKLPRYKCNWCGTEYSDEDCHNNPFGIVHTFGYENRKHDGDTLDVDLCSTCTDKLADYIIEKSMVECANSGGFDWDDSE